MSILVRFSLVGLLASSSLIGLAQAQDEYYSREKYEAVNERQQPEFDPEVIRLGGLVVRSNAQLGVTSTSNALASSDNESSDTILRVGAEAGARTDWSNHEIGLEASVFRDEYSDNSNESSTDVRGRLRGRLDVSRTFSVTATGFAEKRSESRTDFANAVGLNRPIDIQRTGGGLEAAYRADRLRWTTSIDTSDYDFDDGQVAGGTNVFDQDFRDRTLTNGRTRITYAVSPNFALFGQGSAYSSEYDNIQTVDILDPVTGLVIGTAQRSRDSEGYTVEAGADFELQTLLRGDIAVGFLSEDKADPNFQDVDGLSLDGRLEWFPSRLTTVGFDAGRRVIDLGLIEAPSATQTRFGVRIDHELRRNIILSAFGRISDNEYDDIDRSEELTELGVQGLYKLNKRVHVEAFVRRLDRDVSGTQVIGNPDFDVTLVGVGFKVFP